MENFFPKYRCPDVWDAVRQNIKIKYQVYLWSVYSSISPHGQQRLSTSTLVLTSWMVWAESVLHQSQLTLRPMLVWLNNQMSSWSRGTTLGQWLRAERYFTVNMMPTMQSSDTGEHWPQLWAPDTPIYLHASLLTSLERRFKQPHCNTRCYRTSRGWLLHLFWNVYNDM